MRCSIPYTIELLVRCWFASEAETASEIKETHHRAGEEFITEFFTNVLNRNLRVATQTGAVAAAFERDLSLHFPTFFQGSGNLRRYSQRLYMACDRHDKQREGKHGGDFGLTVFRPSIQTGSHTPRIATQHQGLLCQAKLRKGLGGWRALSKKQCQVLPENFGFAALTLYEYDDSERQALHPFKWQLCRDASVSQVQRWLKTGSFPKPYSSNDVIRGLADKRIGTSEPKVIDEKIATPARPTIAIRIDWPDGAKPPPLSQLVRNSQPARQRISVLAG